MDETHRAALAELLAEHRAARAQLERLEEKIEMLRARLENPPVPWREPAEALPPLSSIQAYPPIPAPPPLPIPPVSRDEPAPEAAPEIPVEKKSLEMQLGTVWLVRAGIVILLTGLVFAGNYAYQNFIERVGPAGKLALLGLCGAILGSLGAWLERRGVALRHYARVLMAGGFATIYYAAYAAHFVPGLRIIESPFVAGALLLALAGGFIAFAQRRQSQTLALGAVLLSYYTSAINPLAGFTLFSNLLLTAAAVFFLVRNRWTTISFASIVATYASYGYWRSFHENTFSLQLAPHADFWTGTLYLLGYWTLFTAGALLSKTALRGSWRAVFVSFNNAAFFGYVATTLPQFQPHAFWIFSLVFGAALLVLAFLANRTRRDDPVLDATYLAQGLLLVTIGLAAKITGYQLALVLALESAALVTCARARHGWLFQIAAGFCASTACGLGLDKIDRQPALALPLGSVLCLAFLYDARWLKHLTLTERKFNWRAAVFSALGVAIGFVLIWNEVAPENYALAFALVTVALTLGTFLHGLFELALVGQFYICATAFFWLDRSAEPATWLVTVLVGCLIALQQWWKRQPPFDNFFGPVYVAAGLGLFGQWTLAQVPEPRQFAFVTAAALVLLSGAALRKSRTALVVATVLVATALTRFWILDSPHLLISWNTLALLALLVAQRLASKRVNLQQYPEKMQMAVAGILLATLWMHVSRWAGADEREFLMTISWTLLAAGIFAAGLAGRERVYRLGGLVILAATIGRIFLVDVWRLEMGYRILSFLLLGVVLLVLGFVYNKLADKIRTWI